MEVDTVYNISAIGSSSSLLERTFAAVLDDPYLY